MKIPSPPERPKGFSIIELLIVIAVIGVIAGISIRSISGMFYKGETIKNYRNAQSIVSAFNAARAAGNQDAYSKNTALDAVTTTTGISGAGNLSNAKFAAPMSAVEKNLAGVLIMGAITADTTSTLVVN